jgi:hypothetical protein
MIRLIGDLVSQLMFIGLILGLGASLTFFGVGLLLWIKDKIQELLK